MTCFDIKENFELKDIPLRWPFEAYEYISN
jgi:hypothetical protein